MWINKNKYERYKIFMKDYKKKLERVYIKELKANSKMTAAQQKYRKGVEQFKKEFKKKFKIKKDDLLQESYKKGCEVGYLIGKNAPIVHMKEVPWALKCSLCGEVIPYKIEDQTFVLDQHVCKKEI